MLFVSSWFEDFLLLLQSEYKVFIILHGFSFSNKIKIKR